MINPFDALGNNELERTKRVVSILRAPQIKGVFSDSRVVFHSMVMEKLEPYIFSLESVPKLISDLRELHQNSIFHKDINPTNIMQTKDKQAVFIDFANDRSATFFHPIPDIDIGKWNVYDLKALGKVLFVLKHITKINKFISSLFDTSFSDNKPYYYNLV